MNTLKVALMLLCMTVSSSARSLLQEEVRATSVRGRPQQDKGNRRGTVFKFKTNQNALAEFNRIDRDIDPGLIDRIMKNSDFKGDRSKLAHDLENDDDMGIDLDNEAILFQCEGLAANVSEADRQAAEIASGLGPGDADPLAANAWTLSSRPTSTKKLWLDFKGGDVTGTAWNVARNTSTITIPPYDKDNFPSSFSTAELNDVVAVWRAVSEDYSPFDVDVTTVPQLGNSPATYMRVMIGGDGAWWGSAGGVAYVGVFGRSDTYYQPAFVFPKNLGPDYAKYIWEAASHEAGHSMGLGHDGTATSGYWQGNSASYGAIMGAGYYSQLTVWDKGEYAGANNLQDDTAIIAGKLGYIASENGNSISTATPLAVTVSGSTATGTASGVITQQNTGDYFQFDAGAGTASISVINVIPWGTFARSDLDAKVDVYNSAGALISTINPSGTSTSNGLGISSATVTLPAAGSYYLAVSGAGLGAANTDTGYSSYGIRGQFALRATYPVTTAAPPPPGPSPPPVSTSLVGSVTMTCSRSGQGSNRKYACTAQVTIKTSTGAVVPDVVVTGRYTTTYAAPDFPTQDYTAITGGNGVATMPTAPWAYKSAYAETFSVVSATKIGYIMTDAPSKTFNF